MLILYVPACEYKYAHVNIVPEIAAMPLSILWLSWVRAGVRRMFHTSFIYYTERQTGREPGTDKLLLGTDKATRLSLEGYTSELSVIMVVAPDVSSFSLVFGSLPACLVTFPL